jgi:hypothetical protein
MNIASVDVPTDILRSIFKQLHPISQIPYLLVCKTIKLSCKSYLNHRYCRKFFKNNSFFYDLTKHCVKYSDLLKWYCDNNFPINIEKAIHYAIRIKANETFVWLLQEGQICTQDHLKAAILYGNSQVAKQLINNGLTSKRICSLIRNFNIDVIKLYLDKNPDTLFALMRVNICVEEDKILYLINVVETSTLLSKIERKNIIHRLKTCLAKFYIVNNELEKFKSLNTKSEIPPDAPEKSHYEVLKYLIDNGSLIGQMQSRLLLRNNRIDLLDYVYNNRGSAPFLSINKDSLVSRMKLETINWLHIHNILTQNVLYRESIFKGFARLGRSDTLQWLYKQGYDLNNLHEEIASSANLKLLTWYTNIYGIKNETGMTKAAIFYLNKGEKVLSWLKKNNVNLYEDEKYLCYAINRNNIKVVMWLLHHSPREILTSIVFKFSLLKSPEQLSRSLLKRGCCVASEDKIYIKENNTLDVMLVLDNKDELESFVSTYLNNNKL